MKKFKRIVIWTLIPLSLQFSFLFYLNNFFWNTEKSFNITKIEDKISDKKFKIDVEIPSGAKDIKASYNGKHISYFINGKLVVVNTESNGKKEIELPKNVVISNYKWLPDRDRMILAEKHINGQQAYIKFTSFDSDKGDRTELADNHGKEVKISLPDSKYEVDNMTLSTATSVMYIKVSRLGYKSRIYHMNVMSQIQTSQVDNFKLGNMEVLNTEDIFIYEDLTHNKLVLSDNKKIININKIKKPRLLATDDDDNIYVGEEENEKITKIYYGKLDTNIEEWKSISLPQGIEAKDIIVSKLGKIFINDNFKGEVSDIIGNKVIKYRGNFFGIYDNGIIIKENNRLKNLSF